MALTSLSEEVSSRCRRGLRDVLPTLVVEDVLDRRVAHPEGRSDLSLRESLACETTDDGDVLRLEPRGSSCFPSEGPPLRVPVPHVVVVSPEEEMRRVAARRVVAAMKNEETLRNRAVRPLPREPMREVDASPAVPAANAGTGPDPTLVRSSGHEVVIERPLPRHALEMPPTQNKEER